MNALMAATNKVTTTNFPVIEEVGCVVAVSAVPSGRIEAFHDTSLSKNLVVPKGIRSVAPELWEVSSPMQLYMLISTCIV